MKLEDYNKELEAAMGGLKQLLAQAQVTMGVIESFIYLVKKESAQQENQKTEVINPVN